MPVEFKTEFPRVQVAGSGILHGSWLLGSKLSLTPNSSFNCAS